MWRKPVILYDCESFKFPPALSYHSASKMPNSDTIYLIGGAVFSADIQNGDLKFQNYRLAHEVIQVEYKVDGKRM